MAWYLRILVVTLFGALLLAGVGSAEDSGDQTSERQKQLNEAVLLQPFSVEEQAKLEAYLQDALKRKIVPGEYTGTHWRRGYTCRDLRPYSYYEYRDCMYYYRYYGRYYRWP
jgi:hypothetical protein